MSHEPLQLEEVRQLLREQLGREVQSWAQELLEDVGQTHGPLLLSSASESQKEEALRRHLDESLHRLVRTRLLERSLGALQSKGWLQEEWLFQLQGRMRLLVEEVQLPFSLSLQFGTRLLQPLAASAVVLALGFVGLLVGNQLEMAKALSLVGSAGACYLLLQLQKSSLSGSKAASFWRKLLRGLSTEASQTHNWKDETLAALQQTLQAALEVMATLLWSVSSYQQLQQESQIQYEEADLAQFIESCHQGLSEVAFAEMQRDPERALDACIQLMEDLKLTGLELETVEKGAPFSEEWGERFVTTGRVEEGDPVVMIHPAWHFRGALLTPGRIKKMKKK